MRTRDLLPSRTWEGVLFVLVALYVVSMGLWGVVESPHRAVTVGVLFMALGLLVIARVLQQHVPR